MYESEETTEGVSRVGVLRRTGILRRGGKNTRGERP